MPDDEAHRLEEPHRGRRTPLPRRIPHRGSRRHPDHPPVDRGLLREGYWADLVVFDPARVADRATFEHPKQYPLGIDYVLVNGGLVVDAGDHSGARPGRVLYGAGKR